MGANTVLHFGGEHEVFYNFSGIARLTMSSAYTKFMPLDPQPISLNEANLEINALNFISDKKKVFISVMNGPFHFLHDSLGHALYAIEKYPDAQFIFDISPLYVFDDAYKNHFFETLMAKNIDFKVVNLKEGDVIVANNFYWQRTMHDECDAGNKLYEFFKSDYKNPDAEPFRKIYLSRRRMHNRDYSFLDNGPSFKHDNRIINEPLLESFLSDLGFEIIVPEEFSSFKEQINHFNETKTVVSSTSSGLTCSAFMKPRNNLVEITNTMVVPIGNGIDPDLPLGASEEGLHHYYVALAFNKDHNYFSIPNKTRKAEDIIEKIKTSKSMNSVFEIG